MNRKKEILLGIIAAILVLGMFAAVGCGKKEDASSDSGKGKYVYLPKGEEVNIGDGYISHYFEKEGILYYLLTETNPETGETKNRLNQMELASGKIEEVPIMEIGADSYIQKVKLQGEDNFIFWVSQYSDQQTEYILYQTDKRGNTVSKKDYTQIVSDMGLTYVQNMEINEQGNICLAGSDVGGKNKILVLDSADREVCKLDFENYINSIFIGDDNNFYITCYSQSGMEMRMVDVVNKAIKEPVDMGQIRSLGNLILGAGESVPLVSDGLTVYEGNPTSGQMTPLFNWLDSGVAGNNVTGFGSTQNGDIWVLVSNYSFRTNSAKLRFTMLAKTPVSEVKEKEIIVFGTTVLRTDIETAIIKFNKTNEKYKIQVREYPMDVEGGQAQFIADIASKNGPDIIDLIEVNMNKLVAKGVLEDLRPYITGKDGLSEDEYLENVMAAFTVDDKQYGLPIGFNVYTLAGKTSIVGDKQGWTVDEMMQLEQSRPESKMFEGEAIDVLRSLLWVSTDQFVNWETGECSFDGDEFIKMLEYAKKYQKDSTQAPAYGISREALLNDEILLTQCYVNSLTQIQMMEGVFGEPATFIGYPVSDGIGAMIQANNTYGMNAKSKQKDGVWEFFRFLMSEEYQVGLTDGTYGFGWTLPVKRSAIDSICKEAMRPDYYTDENGQKTEKVKSNWWGFSDYTVEVYAATEKDVEMFWQVIENVDRSYQDDIQLYNIVQEESESYFSGQKSAKEAADVIQNRMQLYVNESR